MLILVRIIGIVMVGMGVMYLLKPKTLKQFVAFFEKGRRLYIAGILRIVIGVILLAAASQCRLVGVVLALGVLALIGGIVIFILGLERIKSMLNWWNKRSPLVLRLVALVALALGALLLYSA